MPTCSTCDTEFTGSKLRRVCDALRRKTHIDALRRRCLYKSVIESNKRYKMTLKGRESQAKSNASAYSTTQRSYRNSERGRASIRQRNARSNAKRRTTEGLTEYEAFVAEVRSGKPFCVTCSKPWIDSPRGHQIDHILAIGLGGTHHRKNLQVLCFECHKAKTKVDRREMSQNRTRDMVRPENA